MMARWRLLKDHYLHLADHAAPMLCRAGSTVEWGSRLEPADDDAWAVLVDYEVKRGQARRHWSGNGPVWKKRAGE